MSVYIPGIEMPKSCPCELLGTGYDLFCSFAGGIPARVKEYYECCQNDTRPSWCPLIPVPDHGDLIDKSGVAVLSWTDGEYGTDFADGVLFVLDKLDELPVVIPAEGEDYVVPSDKEGEG